MYLSWFILTLNVIGYLIIMLESLNHSWGFPIGIRIKHIYINGIDGDQGLVKQMKLM
jgi:hypothetical protein